MEHKVGIDRMHLYIPPQYIEMEELALARGIDPAKYTVGIGQSQMAVTDATQDIVMMAINAARPLLKEEDLNQIDQVIVATESAFDYSKAAAIYVHEALGIHPYARSYEIKEACYGGTAAVLAACDYVRLRPERKVLVITSDIARYGLATGGEPTQGAGAVAMLISSTPQIIAFDTKTTPYTNNQFDFWRPDYSPYPMVEGKFSTQLYLDSFAQVVKQSAEKDPQLWESTQAIALHLPFTKMGLKAIRALREDLTEQVEAVKAIDRWESHYQALTALSRRIGNIYTGSLYLGLLSLLCNDPTIKAGDQIGLFSYGSGAVAEWLSGELQVGYQAGILQKEVEDQLTSRRKLKIEEYETLYRQALSESDSIQEYEPSVGQGDFYLARIDHHRRYYERNHQAE